MNTFCGHEGAGFRRMLGLPRPESNIAAWFWDECEYVYLHLARTGIDFTRELLSLNPRDEILAPAYNCGAELDPLIKSGLSVSFFRVRLDGTIDLDDLCSRINSRTKAIYITHYFGFPQPVVEAVREICWERNLFLLEDCALALLSKDASGKKLGTYGDVSFFSFAKFLPVPDGGLLVINNLDLRLKSFRLVQANFKNVASKILPLIKSEVLLSLSRSRKFNPLYASLFRILAHKKRAMAEQRLTNCPGMAEMLPHEFFSDDFKHRKISALSRNMLETFDIGKIVRTRRHNFSLLLERLSCTDRIKPLFDNLPEGVCPLAFPVIAENRDRLAAQLNANAIDAITWWKGYHPAFSWEGFP